MRNKFLEKITKEQLLKDLDTFKSTNKVASHYDVNIYSVNKACDNFSIDYKIRRDLSKILTYDVLKSGYEKIKSTKKLARELSVDIMDVKRYMDSFNIDYKKQVIYSCNHDFFQEDSEESFYWAGFIAADGCVLSRTVNRSKPNMLSISLESTDTPHLLKFKNQSKAESIISFKTVKNSLQNSKWKDTDECEIKITSTKICKDLERFNVVMRKTKIYDLPSWILTHDLLPHFIRGYNDGDGSFYWNKKAGRADQLYFSMRGNSEYLLKIRKVLEKECSLVERIKPIRISSGHGVLEYGGNLILKRICNYLYKNSTIYLDRKFEIIKHLLTENS